MPTFEWTTDFYLKTAKSLKLRGNAWVSPIPVWWLNLGLATTHVPNRSCRKHAA